MDRQSSAPGASAISDGSGNLPAGGARGSSPVAKLLSSMAALLSWSAPPTLA